MFLSHVDKDMLEEEDRQMDGGLVTGVKNLRCLAEQPAAWASSDQGNACRSWPRALECQPRTRGTEAPRSWVGTGQGAPAPGRIHRATERALRLQPVPPALGSGWGLLSEEGVLHKTPEPREGGRGFPAPTGQKAAREQGPCTGPEGRGQVEGRGDAPRRSCPEVSFAVDGLTHPFEGTGSGK